MPFLFQRSDPEQKQSIPSTIIDTQQTAPGIDWRVVGIFALVILFLWFCGVGYTGYVCAQAYAYTCPAQAFAFWSLPLIVFVSTLLVAIGGAWYNVITWRNRAEKERLANAFSQHYDVWDVRAMQKLVIQSVAAEIAKSLASAEIDTWSPTNSSHSETSSTSVATVADSVAELDIPVDTDKSVLEDLIAKGHINRSDNSLFVGYSQ